MSSDGTSTSFTGVPGPPFWPPAPSDLELVERVTSGDVDAYQTLVERYQYRVYNHAARMLGSTDDAADVTQEVFVKTYTTLNQYRGQASFQTWLYRVTANLCVDRHRRRQRLPHVTRSLDAPLETEAGEVEAEVPDWGADPARVALSGELQAKVHAALAALSDKLRAVIVMYDLDGLSYEEIAGALGIPLGTVKSRLFHARAQLRTLLAPYVSAALET
jgi:RNA polymerase sigma-70 factor (ECF subfamily)